MFKFKNEVFVKLGYISSYRSPSDMHVVMDDESEMPKNFRGFVLFSSK